MIDPDNTPEQNSSPNPELKLIQLNSAVLSSMPSEWLVKKDHFSARLRFTILGEEDRLGRSTLADVTYDANNDCLFMLCFDYVSQSTRDIIKRRLEKATGLTAYFR